MQMNAQKKQLLVWGALALAGVAAAILVLPLLSGPRGPRFEEIFGRTIMKARLVGQMRVSLLAAAEAEKSAVLAETDEASVEFARRAWLSVGQVATALAECKGLVSAQTPDADMLQRFEEGFGEYRKVDEEVLALAVQNTNLKAQALSFDQASAALARMEQALSQHLKAPRGTPQAVQAGRLAARALAEALRIQTLHAPHIMEKTEARMDELEARMAKADKLVRASLASLSDQGGQAAAVPALAAYEDFQKVTAEVVRLSRQNTNVLSLALSLDRKTKVLAVCDEALRALEEKIQADMAKGTR
ncbi:MAG: hypothetical protein Q7U56_11060 [Humidesulfovibrio sp.]|nr:hypothetical protein [Humidesulfovibrio sp.]